MNREQQIEEAKKCREEIFELQKKQDKIFEDYITKHSFSEECEPWVWDYLFNTHPSEDDQSYEKYVEGNAWPETTSPEK
jgi:hypothetical protein